MSVVLKPVIAANESAHGILEQWGFVCFLKYLFLFFYIFNSLLLPG